MNRPVTSLFLSGTLTLGLLSQALGFASLPPSLHGYTPAEIVAKTRASATLVKEYASELGIKPAEVLTYVGSLHTERTATSLQTTSGVLAAGTGVLADAHGTPILLAADGSLIHLVSAQLSTAMVANMANIAPAPAANQNPSVNDLVPAANEEFTITTQQPAAPSSRKQDFGQKVFNSVLGGLSVPWLGLVSHSGGKSQVQPAPEPMSDLVLLSGIVGLVASRIRRKR